MKILPILTGSVLLLLSFTILRAEQELRPYRLVNADRLFVDRLENEYLTRLNGNVHFFYGETEFFSDQAEIYEEQKLVRMIECSGSGRFTLSISQPCRIFSP